MNPTTNGKMAIVTMADPEGKQRFDLFLNDAPIGTFGEKRWAQVFVHSLIACDAAAGLALKVSDFLKLSLGFASSGVVDEHAKKMMLGDAAKLAQGLLQKLKLLDAIADNRAPSTPPSSTH